MIEKSAETKGLRVPTFGGKQEDFHVWWTRFMAYSAVYKFVQALKVGGEVNLPATEATVIDFTTETGKKQVAALKRNEIAVANMTMAFTSEATIYIVYKAMTNDWPGGLVHQVVSALFKKYRHKATYQELN